MASARGPPLSVVQEVRYVFECRLLSLGVVRVQYVIVELSELF